MIQTIITYIIIGVAAGYTVYSIVKQLFRKNTDLKCGSSCEGCRIKDCYRTSVNKQNHIKK